ncbi:unnamed protein product, partial [Sphacelaria rigidula]
YAAQNVQQKVPRTFREAMELADAKLWRAATRKEMDSLEELRVFTLVPRKTVPTGSRIYKPQWVFKIKTDNSHKARLNDVVIILTLYMDDLLLVGADIQVIQSIKQKLVKWFKMTDMGDVSLVLGMQVTRDRQEKTITISQEKYTRSILEKFGMVDCKPVSTP